ncbi:hypothetical protein J6590_037584, partial [Homalodisca vitripennis]
TASSATSQETSAAENQYHIVQPAPTLGSGSRANQRSHFKGTGGLHYLVQGKVCINNNRNSIPVPKIIISGH